MNKLGWKLWLALTKPCHDHHNRQENQADHKRNRADCLFCAATWLEEQQDAGDKDDKETKPKGRMTEIRAHIDQGW